ncbi:hypothetical protein LSH36_12g33050 [Paralvinella palmiformis]|uniref:Uncharacterized protein n=1 Tax=Paralvinella palmiformis TaxID=53620 RepID=A0AAD9KED3_9ANNE|nr:hypothetical protein LSH36_12g33050 [Paralvinella palmiformis]
MPPGIIPNPTKKKLRPSSAAANLQTHPSYSSGLFDDNVRPTTGSATKAPGPAGLLAQRPKTQASGPRYWGKPAQPLLSDTSEATQRRLTVGHVEGIAGTQPKGGRPFGHKSISNFFMGKDKFTLKDDSIWSRDRRTRDLIEAVTADDYLWNQCSNYFKLFPPPVSTY